MSSLSQRRRGLAQARWEALGSTVVLRLTDPSALGSARAAVELELEQIDRACSRFRPDSELVALNAHAARSTPVSSLLMEAISLALRAAELTDGDVDPTLGRALELAGYDRDWRLLDPPCGQPEQPPTVTARTLSGWRSVELDRERSTVRLPTPIKLDLGASAKAWAADRAATAASAAGDCGALVSLGGDIATSGAAPSDGWRIHVTDDHRSAPDAPGQTIAIRSGGLATSSTAVRRWSHAGRTMHHIVDPVTGSPVRNTWRTVSVAAANCADANIATTAALVRAAAAPAWLASNGLPARLLACDGRVTLIGGWPEREPCCGEHRGEPARSSRQRATRELRGSAR
jgi:thiamine biosynthesis lipoprotein